MFADEKLRNVGVAPVGGPVQQAQALLVAHTVVGLLTKGQHQAVETALLGMVPQRLVFVKD